MNNDSQWLLMTYYCPTHGSEDRCEPLQISQNELKKVKSEYNNELTKIVKKLDVKNRNGIVALIIINLSVILLFKFYLKGTGLL